MEWWLSGDWGGGGGNGEMWVRGYKLLVTRWVSSGKLMYITVNVVNNKLLCSIGWYVRVGWGYTHRKSERLWKKYSKTDSFIHSYTDGWSFWKLKCITSFDVKIVNRMYNKA